MICIPCMRKGTRSIIGNNRICPQCSYTVTRVYHRVCRRCHDIYETAGKYSRICPECSTFVPWNRRNYNGIPHYLRNSSKTL